METTDMRAADKLNILIVWFLHTFLRIKVM